MVGLLNGSGIAAFADKSGFEIEASWFDAVVVISVSGALDLRTSPELTAAVELAANMALTAVIVDLTGVDFLASTGMNVLVAAHRDITPATGFGVVAHGPVTRRPLVLLGLDKLIACIRPVMRHFSRSVKHSASG